MRHPKAILWEKKLDGVFRRIDKHLEEAYGSLYPLHPVRAQRGPTGHPEHDGLFRVGAAFSAGFGAKKGPGYVVQIDMMTLENVDPEIRMRIENAVAERLREELPEAFPGKDLRVERDGPSYKIYGDLHLGTA